MHKHSTSTDRLKIIGLASSEDFFFIRMEHYHQLFVNIRLQGPYLICNIQVVKEFKMISILFIYYEIKKRNK